jgi:pimeloyl-ACP methyl ester carboxylesterase
MAYVTNRGQRIHYAVEGAGPLVVLQHGLLSNGESWKKAGIVDALSDRFQVACVDSLAHGLSDKPDDPSLYRAGQRAADIVAVLDDLGAERAHLVGYSMGGWMAVAVAARHPQRLASLTVAGWDLVKGVESARPPRFKRELNFNQFMMLSRYTTPALVAWVTPEIEPGLRACWAAATDLEGAEEAVLACGAPLMLWDGRDDLYHGPMQAFAAEHGVRFLSTAGDHLGALLTHGAEAAAGLRAFFDDVEAVRAGARAAVSVRR